MASAAEQLASNLDFRLFSKAEELKKRIWFTLGALIIYRLGTYIPLPGVDMSVIASIAQRNATGILGMVDMFSGGALWRMTIFALNIMPYITSSIIVQLLGAVYPPWQSLRKEGESGRKKLNQYTRYGTVLLASIQAFALAKTLESQQAVLDPGLFFEITTVLTVVGSTMFLVWLGEQITSRGIGNGISLIIFSGIVANLPQAALRMIDMGREGEYHVMFILFILALLAGVIAFIIFVERAQLKVVIQQPKRQMGQKVFGGESSHLPLKINNAGVIPAIFASSLLLLPMTVLGGLNVENEFLQKVIYYVQPGQPVYMILSSLLITFFAFFYTALMFNPEETAENLKKSGTFIPGIRPGASTAEYLDYVLTRLTVVGAAYLVTVCLLPELLKAKYALPFYLGGTSLLIVVGVTMDTVAQLHSHLLAYQYEGLLKKSRFNLKK
ncbi:MAG: preprotein translocase subunit SecY [Alphaproteobacteria bacterium RIFCSPHIGHO2_01_FULL_41_14]|nr:MAG: preprotein translocase subunit SecY [Alphaproteobacteria bacterium GWA1_45_9]OFW90069.1 MAG: preprotein translocase subunit SecY [Alphaproteobacteria bacterium RIFCSPHIGHO2_01_FULL_41_14]HCI48554.1 preprotein translocase subunit SecY [Holosporales bacterium]